MKTQNLTVTILSIVLVASLVTNAAQHWHSETVLAQWRAHECLNDPFIVEQLRISDELTKHFRNSAECNQLTNDALRQGNAKLAEQIVQYDAQWRAAEDRVREVQTQLDQANQLIYKLDIGGAHITVQFFRAKEKLYDANLLSREEFTADVDRALTWARSQVDVWEPNRGQPNIDLHFELLKLLEELAAKL